MQSLKSIKQAFSELNGEAYYTGTFILNILKSTKHRGPINVIVKNIPINKVASKLRQHGSVKKSNAVGAPLLSFKHAKDETIIYIDMPRRTKARVPDKNNTLNQNTRCGDFTVTSLYLPVNYEHARTELIDLSSGIKDITENILRCLHKPSTFIAESPIKILTAIRLCAEFGFKLENSLRKAIRNNTYLLITTDPNEIRQELNKILLLNKPSKAFTLMEDLGVLEIILPELHNCAHIKQEERYHKYTVLNHCLYTADHIDSVLELRLAALFHDVGKPQTYKIIKDRITFHKHEFASATIAKRILKRLNYDIKLQHRVVNLIKLHMYHYTVGWSDAAVRKFIKKIRLSNKDIKHIEKHPVFKLRKADRLGGGTKSGTISKVQRQFLDRIKKLYKKLTIDK